MHASGKSAVLGRAADCLACLPGLFHPFSCYRVYDVENTELMGSGCTLEMRKELLDQDRLGLKRADKI